MPDGTADTPFAGTDRFRVLERLGGGASGEVYRALDTAFGHVVALKTLQHLEPAAVYRFKKEFRALADLAHPNLVQLYELHTDGDLWFYTMELVTGHDFLDWVRGTEGGASADAPTVELDDSTLDYTRRLSLVDHGLPPPSVPPAEIGRLRAALPQLVRGLDAAHRAGRLHCDVKPGNIRVTNDGRVVLLDFGLVKHLFAAPRDRSLELELSGTPVYMSPEQSAGLELTPASDWYAVGVLLYEALTGETPYRGGYMRVLADKQTIDPVPPRRRFPGLPADLDRLCMRLMARDPADRPDAATLLAWLDDGAPPARDAVPPLVGRGEHLQRLHRALDGTRRELRPAVVALDGGPGMGKSHLLASFLDEVRARFADAVVLLGRCYERESMSYKALDAVIDALTRTLRQLPRAETQRLLPPGMRALCRLFPVLERVETVAWVAGRESDLPDPATRRLRARLALRTLLARLAARAPVVIAIDDLQWGDRDSVDLLRDVLAPPDPPPVLLLLAYRRAEAATSPVLRHLLAEPILTPAPALGVDELAPADALDLARTLLADRAGAAELDPLAAAIARESGGNPYFIGEMARQAKVDGPHRPRDDDSAATSIDRLIRTRASQLDPAAQGLLAVVAAAGGPIPLQAALDAADLGDAAPNAVARLRGASLIHIRRAPQAIEPYHNRIGESVYRGLDPAQRRALHARLAAALAAVDDADPETVADHHRRAGDREAAARCTAQAADRAWDTLAFARAARLYEQALDDAGAPPDPRLAARRRDALALAQRAVDGGGSTSTGE